MALTWTRRPNAGLERMGNYSTRLQTPSMRHRWLLNIFKRGSPYVQLILNLSMRSPLCEHNWLTCVKDLVKTTTNHPPLHPIHRPVPTVNPLPFNALFTALHPPLHRHFPRHAYSPFQPLPTLGWKKTCQTRWQFGRSKSGSKNFQLPNTNEVFSTRTFPRRKHGGPNNRLNLLSRFRKWRS